MDRCGRQKRSRIKREARQSRGYPLAVHADRNVDALARAQTPAPDADGETPVTVRAPIGELLLSVPLTLGHDRVVQLHAGLSCVFSQEQVQVFDGAIAIVYQNLIGRS